MAHLSNEQIFQLKSKLTTDELFLKRLYRAKKDKLQIQSVAHALVDDLIDEGWTKITRLKTKTKLGKPKPHNIMFEDEIWCQFYELGYRHFNFDETFVLPWGAEPGQDKQIDVVVIDEDHVFLIECKSQAEGSKPTRPNFKEDLDALSLRLDGFRKSIADLVAREVKVKYILATKNKIFNKKDVNYKRLTSTRSFHYSEHIYRYVENLIKHYNTPRVKAAKHQFLGLIFKETTIGEKIQVPAIKGTMGGRTYYSFSIEPIVLLKIGFILHQTRFNTDNFPTYQRLLKPNRLPDIRKFIEQEKGFFPNSIIINFSTETNEKFKLEFNSASQKGIKTSAKHGVLKLPNAYAIAYIIDGQHRLYGYAGSEHAKNDQIPVVAFENLDEVEQLEIFMKINEKQKAVPKTLITALEKDMLWDAKLLADRLKALRSSIASELADGEGPLAGMVTIGEENISSKNKISGDFIVRGLNPTAFNNGLLPRARGDKFDEKTTLSLYETNNLKHNEAMEKAQESVVDLINSCYTFIEEHAVDLFNRPEYFFTSSRGVYALLIVLGEINAHLIESKKITRFATTASRMKVMENYLIALIEGIKGSSEEKQENLLALQGAGAHIPWIMYFIEIINLGFPNFKPNQYLIWQEQQDEELQDKAKKYADSIEKFLLNTVLDQLKNIYKDRWEIEVATMKIKCTESALKQQAENSKTGLGDHLEEWTEMLQLSDFRTLIMDHWTNKPDEPDEIFKTFADIFSYDAGFGYSSKSDKVKWLQTLNGLRRKVAHSAIKLKPLSRDNVNFIEDIYLHFKLDK